MNTNVNKRIELSKGGLHEEWLNQYATLTCTGEAESWDYKITDVSVIIADKCEVSIFGKYQSSPMLHKLINRRVSELVDTELEEEINELFWGMSREEYKETLMANYPGDNDSCYGDTDQFVDEKMFG